MTRHKWTELPISAEIISDVEALAKSQDQPIIDKHGYHFSYSRIKSFSHNFESVPSSDDDTEGTDPVEDDVSHTSDTSSDSTYEENDTASDSSLPPDTEDIPSIKLKERISTYKSSKKKNLLTPHPNRMQ